MKTEDLKKEIDYFARTKNSRIGEFEKNLNKKLKELTEEMIKNEGKALS
jgi:uncharacterized protein YaaR (DUF327 family)